MNMKPSPLLVVDVQSGFVNDRSRHVVPVVQRLADKWLDLGWPIYLSQFTNKHDSQWVKLLGWSRLMDESEIALAPELDHVRPHATVYRKQSYTCVVGPFLDDARSAEWTDVVVCGIATDSCVLATAVDLFEFSERDLRPLVVSDACASHAGEHAHESGLFIIQRFIGSGQIVSSRELLDEGELSRAPRVGDPIASA